MNIFFSLLSTPCSKWFFECLILYSGTSTNENGAGTCYFEILTNSFFEIILRSNTLNIHVQKWNEQQNHQIIKLPSYQG